MERKTWRRFVDGYEDVGLRDGVSVGDAICDLADFEDTGLAPEEFKELLNDSYGPLHIKLSHALELLKAEQDGRCVVLPCKVGDICYEIDPGHSGVIEHTVTATTIYSKKADGKRYMEDFSNLLVIETYAVAEDGCEWTDQYTAEEWTDAPKTRAEAEAALKGDAPNE